MHTHEQLVSENHFKNTMYIKNTLISVILETYTEMKKKQKHKSTIFASRQPSVHNFHPCVEQIY